jgi:CheY-like chemotaxis protein
VGDAELKEPGRVLVVDDHAALRRALVRRLAAQGYVISEAANGQEAAKLVADGKFEAVLSDIRMPDMDGIQLLELLHERDPELPVILMTGTPELETAMKAVQFGAFEYLAKPVELDKLNRSVARAVDLCRIQRARRAALASVEKRLSHDASADPESWSGTMLAGRYLVGALIGKGGMGSVYEAERQDLAMRVAIKILHPGYASREDLVSRFRREAQVVATIDHPNIVKVLDFHADGPIFLVMERLHGTSLAAAITRDGQLASSRVAFIASQMLSALAAAHRANVIHRDLKPDNVFLTSMSNMNDIVKLLDFGIAKLMGQPIHEKLTETGIVLGTPAYMAPEYARAGTMDERGDIYAVGCVMYEALVGQEPFVAENYNALLYAIQEREAEPLRKLCPDAPKGLCEVVEKAMSKDPDDRYYTAESMIEALEPWVVPVSSVRSEVPTIEPASVAPTEMHDSLSPTKPRPTKPRPAPRRR